MKPRKTIKRPPIQPISSVVPGEPAFTMRQLDIIREMTREMARQEIDARLTAKPPQRGGCCE